MSNQNEAQIADVLRSWSQRAPAKFKYAGTDTLQQGYEKLLDQHIQKLFGGVYNQANLDVAAVYVLLSLDHKAQLAAMEQQFKAELAEQAWKQRLHEVQKWVGAHPNFKQDDQALGVIRDFFANNPNASLQDWDDYCSQHPDDPRMWIKPSALDVVALVRGIKASNRVEYDAKVAKLKTVYGAERVDAAFAQIQEGFAKRQNLETWRETPQEIAERHKHESAEAKQREDERQKKLEARAQVEAESIVSGFRGQSHAESFRVREQLKDILAYKPNSNAVDWQATAEARRTAVAQYQGKNPALVNPQAV